MKQKPHRDRSDQEEKCPEHQESGGRCLRGDRQAPHLGRSDRPCFSHRAWFCPGWVQPWSWEMTSASPPLLSGPGAKALVPGPWVPLWLTVGCAGVGRVSRLAGDRGHFCGSRELEDLDATAVSLIGGQP